MSKIIDYVDTYTSHDDWYSVYTVQLGELVEKGVFDWSLQVLDWSSAAFDDDQYKRVCDYFMQKYYYREISIEPFLEWARTLRYKLVYELMPKYKPLYERVKDTALNPFMDSDEYYKERAINSDYPETLLSGNADYISDGKDTEHEKIVEGNIADNTQKWVMQYKDVDQWLVEELESMFISMYTTHVNTW